MLLDVAAGRRLDVAWARSGAPESPERAWLRTLVYGAVRLQGRHDHALERVSGRSPRDLDAVARAALRMGAHQILEMSGVPDHAAVSETVQAVKRRRRRAAGLVNAVLRRLARARPGEEIFPRPAVDLEGHLCTWGSHPRWLARRWIDRFGPDGARRLVEANNRAPETYVRTFDADGARALERAGLGRRAGEARGGVRLNRGVDPARALALARGVVQDPAASMVADYVDAEPGRLVADLCAAPGGKALVLSAAGAPVLAADASETRLARLVAGVRRLDAEVWPVVADARRPPLRRAATVLLDVPCTGTATLRRHPDGRWRIRPRTLAALVRTQRALLDAAASLVPRGGALVYATCSLEPEENRSQVESFMARRPDFRVEAGPAPAEFLDDRGCLDAAPHSTGCDGAFAARLRRTRARAPEGRDP